MPSEGATTAERELHEIMGALDVLFTLREELAQWVEEAQSEDRKEELDNIYRHVAAMEAEYQRRRELAEKKLADERAEAARVAAEAKAKADAAAKAAEEKAAQERAAIEAKAKAERDRLAAELAEQKKKLMAMLGTAVTNLHKLDEILPAVKAPRQSHKGYGVTAAHYAPVGAALLWTLEKGPGADLTPEVEAAWTETYTALAGVMTTA